MNQIPGVVGAQYSPYENQYTFYQQQYASSTYEKERHMRPGLIVMAEGIDDVRKTVDYARQNHVAISVRTGGHQYSGASSTDQGNILLDLSTTFKSSDDLKVLPVPLIWPAPSGTYVRTSVSWSLGEFIEFLSQNHLFVPTGQCTNVHLGGHVQTGGFGQLLRSFGLLSDHVTSLELVDANGKLTEVTKQSEPDMFFALLGGSPGNLGVVTHFTLQVHKDSDYNGSLGLLCLHSYSRDKLNHLLDILVKMSEDTTTPRNYDLCFTIRSNPSKVSDFNKDLEDDLKRNRASLYNFSTDVPNFSIIVVYAQWVKLSANDKEPDSKWFSELEQGSVTSKGVQQLPMSELVKFWLFTGLREFDHPYVKRTITTNSSSLGPDGWAKWFSDHVDKICDQDNGLFVSVQVQFSGGQYSQFKNNAGNGTSYSWRDSTVGCTVDCFHEVDKKPQAEAWQAETDTMIGPNGLFAKQQRRLLWGSFGEWDMTKVWQYYHDSEDKYKQLQAARRKADPNGTFTPNPFSVPGR